MLETWCDCLSYLDPENAEYDEERATDEDDVADGSEGGEEGGDDQLQTGRSADHPDQQNYHVQTSLLIVFHQYSISSSGI